MDLIRIYYSKADLMPKVLLKHFLRCIGFYVETVDSEVWEGNGASSVAEVYIISEAFVKSHGSAVRRLDEENTIVIYLDEWHFSDLSSKIGIIFYNRLDEQEFLKSFIQELSRIMKRTVSKSRLIYSMRKWKSAMKRVAEAYLEYEILAVAQYAGCSYKMESVLKKAIESYSGFLLQLHKIESDYDDKQLFLYIQLYIRYELNIICKTNAHALYSSPAKMLRQCEELQLRFHRNEELQLIKAGILLNIQNHWLQAWDEYQAEPVRHCSCVFYKCGWIAGRYLHDYKNAVDILEHIVKKKPDYYPAWFELALCHDETRNYSGAAKDFLSVIKILQEKYKRHLLSPVELEYLYKSSINVALIHLNSFGEGHLAYEYSAFAEKIKQEAKDDSFMNVVCPPAAGDTQFFENVQNEMFSCMNVQIRKRNYYTKEREKL